MTSVHRHSFGFFFFALATVCFEVSAETKTAVRDFPTRPGMAVRALVTTPSNPIGQVILLPGGEGNLGMNPSGGITAPQMADNFTVRTRDLYANAGYVTVVPDTAADVVNLATNREAFAKVRDDVIALAALLRKESALPLWLVGTSASSFRLVLMTPRLQSEVGIAGIALTATANLLPEFSLKAAEKITVPTLVVHHREDACQYSRAESLQPLIDRIKSASKKTVWIEGGMSKGDPCHEWAYHGFNGKESEAVGAVLAWMKSVRESKEPGSN